MPGFGRLLFFSGGGRSILIIREQAHTNITGNDITDTFNIIITVQGRGAYNHCLY